MQLYQAGTHNILLSWSGSLLLALALTVFVAAKIALRVEWDEECDALHSKLCTPLNAAQFLRNNVSCTYDIHDVCGRPENTLCESEEEIEGDCGPTVATTLGILAFLTLGVISLPALQPARHLRSIHMALFEAGFHASLYVLSWSVDRPSRAFTVNALAPICMAGALAAGVLFGLTFTHRVKPISGPCKGRVLLWFRAATAGTTFAGVCATIWMPLAAIEHEMHNPAAEGPLIGFAAVILVLLSHVLRVFERGAVKGLTFLTQDDGKVTPAAEDGRPQERDDNGEDLALEVLPGVPEEPEEFGSEPEGEAFDEVVTIKKRKKRRKPRKEKAPALPITDKIAPEAAMVEDKPAASAGAGSSRGPGGSSRATTSRTSPQPASSRRSTGHRVGFGFGRPPQEPEVVE